MDFVHKPVLLNEVIEGLNINENGIFLDCTLGGAGHSSAILNSINKGVLVGFDKDIDAIKTSSERLSKISKVETLETFSSILNDKTSLIIKSDFKNSPEILKNLNLMFDGILIDLGVSSYQLDNAERGFSFKNEAVLDMRMDTSQSLTAKEIVNTYSESELLKILREYGEEEFAYPIVKNIIKERSKGEIETTTQLNTIVENSMPKKVVFSRNGASKKVFQALRIEVNGELEKLKETIEELIDFLKPNGRIAIISFHSLEDRIVKNVFKDFSTNCVCPPSFPKCVCNHKAKIKLVNKKPIIASENELKDNSRSSCAKLRIAEKI